jgi:hypothetical protein
MNQSEMRLKFASTPVREEGFSMLGDCVFE